MAEPSGARCTSRGEISIADADVRRPNHRARRRQRNGQGGREVTMGPGWLKLITGAFAGSLVLSGCSGGWSTSSTSHSRAPVTTSITASTTSPTPTTSPSTSSTPSSIPTPAEQLTDIAFFNPQMGYGAFTRQGNGTCQYLVGPTTDGGATFGPLTPVTSWTCGNGAPVGAMAFDDHGDGFVYGPELVVTHDGGRTWRQSTQPGSVLSVAALGLSVWMVESRCPASSPQACQLLLFASTDGGRTWSSSSSAPPDAVGNASFDGAQGQTWLVRLSQSTAYLVSNPIGNPQGGADEAPLWLTTDGGSSWSTRSIPCVVGGLSLVLSAAPDGTLLAVCAGEPGAGMQIKSAVRSSNGGITWTDEYSCFIGSSQPPPSCVNDAFNLGYLGEIDAVSADTVYLVGDRSSLLVSHDGGATWQQVNPAMGDTSDGTQQVIFFDRSDGLVFGFDGGNDDAPTFWSTNDGGKGWTALVPKHY